MPGVWNVGNGYNVNTKKVSSKLTFEVGERFTGRVVEKGEGKDITIKLADGWQFIAELDGNVDLDALKLVKFQVDGFENGKLKLKLVKDGAAEEATGDENFQDIIDKEGLSDEDINVLKDMVKHNIPLTRDNITEIKSLIQFSEKMSANPKEMDAFIQKYLQSKGISGDSTEGKAVTELLTKFFNEFKNMTQDDILAFVENNLDFSQENIESFNKLFKGDSSIEQILTKINDSLNSLELETAKKSYNNAISQTLSDNKLNNKEPAFNKNTVDNHTTLASKAYNENDPLTKKINVLDVLKTLAGSEDSELDIIQKNINMGNDNSKIEKANLPASLMEKLDNPEIVKIIKDTLGDSIAASDGPKTQAERLIESANKTKTEELLSNIEGKEVKLSDSEFKAFNQLVNNKMQEKQVPNDNLVKNPNTSNNKTAEANNTANNIQPKEASVNAAKETPVFKEGFGKISAEDLFFKDNLGLNNKEAIKTEMKDKIDGIRDIVKNIIAHTELKDESYEKIMNLIKSNINDIKVFNSVSDEYYYLNVPVTSNLQEYPCKLIIKDNRKDGKKIDTTNAKMIVSVKTAHLGEVDGYIAMRDKKMDVNLKCESEFASVLNKNKSKLVDGLSTLGLFVNVGVSIKDKPVDLANCRNFFNDLTISAIDIKV